MRGQTLERGRHFPGHPAGSGDFASERLLSRIYCIITLGNQTGSQSNRVCRLQACKVCVGRDDAQSLACDLLLCQNGSFLCGGHREMEPLFGTSAPALSCKESTPTTCNIKKLPFYFKPVLLRSTTSVSRFFSTTAGGNEKHIAHLRTLKRLLMCPVSLQVQCS